ncbi:MAG: Chromate transporter [Rhodospirillales bacterium]|jgi:chromate transporter|nr:Chromate transporter [Rhodospirillales bacterium]
MTIKSDDPPPVPLADIAVVFSRIGISSFGGGLVAWIRREAVERNRWVGDREFLSGLALSQVLPGANMTNLAVYLGLLLRGGLGAVTALVALLWLPSIFIIFLYEIYERLHGLGALHFVLDGVAAAAIALNIATGIHAIRRSRSAVTVAVAGAVFLAVGVLHWSMLLVVACLAPVSIVIAWRRRHG